MNKRNLVATTMLAASTCVCQAQTTAAPAAKADVLVKSDTAWNGKPYEHYPEGKPQLTVLKLTIPAHTVLPWHMHSMPNATYILSGHLTVEDKATGQKHTFKAGEAFNEQVDAVHRGFTDGEPVVVVITYAGTPGMATSTPVEGGPAEY
jgi:quercetin dioxygenase-like cupin family protein